MEMLPKTTLLLVFGLMLAVLHSQASTTVPLSQLNPGTDYEEVIDIDETHDNLHDISSDGSGDSDNDDEEESSGNDLNVDEPTGSGIIDQPKSVMVTDTPRIKTMTDCEKHHKKSIKKDEAFIPQCTDTGEYKKVQCKDGTVCWCVSPKGKPIKGTTRKDFEPDCEKGSNLLPCLWDLVRHSSGLLGSFRPNCTESGEYEQVQCRGSECWCSDEHGKEIIGTNVQLPKQPVCVITTLKKVVTPLPTTTTTKANTEKGLKGLLPYQPEILTTGSTVSIPTGSTSASSEITSALSDDQIYETKPNESATEEPGIMAAIIAGAVVGLFVCILLTMFIVYRMRKKDEGSYPLDEPSKSNYSYTKAPDKEFYA